MSAGAEDFPYAQLLWEMTYAEVRLRDQGSLLGFAWTLLHPALMFAVLYELFIHWLGRYVPGYAAYLLMGLVLWNFFARATSYAMTSLRRYKSLLRNYRFPREILVLASVAAVLWSTLLELCVLFPLVVLLGHPPTWRWLILPPLVALLTLLVSGLSLFLAILTVEYQDMERIWEIVTTALFYLTPVFYPLYLIEQGKRDLLLLNPLTQVMIAFRAVVMTGQLPSARMLGVLSALGALSCAAGLWALRRLEFQLADKLMV
jgi:ABC-type polysaccharide/polyol phosphate export permease